MPLTFPVECSLSLEDPEVGILLLLVTEVRQAVENFPSREGLPSMCVPSIPSWERFVCLDELVV